jgi:hypothetical protein
MEQYHAMVQAGILTDVDPVERLEGWLVVESLKNPPHRVATRLLEINKRLPTSTNVLLNKVKELVQRPPVRASAYCYT